MNHPIQYDELWDAFKQGNEAAFSSLYQQYAPVLFNYGSKICADKVVVQDSIQDLFVDLWNSRTRVARTTSVKFYLFKALRYKVLRSISHSGQWEPLDKYMWQLKNLAYEEEHSESEARVFQVKCLRDALKNLPARQREAINLRYFHKFSNEEIAVIMNLSYRSACKVIYAGLKKLTGQLKMPVMEIVILSAVLTC